MPMKQSKILSGSGFLVDWLQGAFIACNVYIKNLQRLEDVVGTALQRWMVEHNSS